MSISSGNTPVDPIDPVVTVGAMVIWRSMVKFSLNRGRVWLKRSTRQSINGIEAFDSDGVTPITLSRMEHVAAVAFFAVAPI